MRNPDVLAELVAPAARRRARCVVGFAAETGDDAGDVLAHGRAKLARKGCDLLVVNDVSGGQVFGQDAQRRDHPGPPTAARPPVPRRARKEAVADAVWDAVVAGCGRRPPTA